MKKLISLLVSCVAGIVFVFLFLVTLDIALFQVVTWQLNDVLIEVLFALALLGLFALINRLNQYYDQAEGYAGDKKIIGRWGKNTLFASLVLCFFLVLLEYLIDSSASLVLFQAKQVELIFVLCLVLWAVIYYFKNYRKMLSRKTRIRALMNKNVKYRDRRFTFVVEEKKEEENEIHLKGILSGSIQVTDEVYAYNLSSGGFMVKIGALKEKGTFVKKAKDSEIEIVLKKNVWSSKIEQYSVLCDMRECVSKDGENVLELPYIRGLITAYAKYHADPKFMSVLLWLIGHAEWLMCAKATDAHSGDIMDVLHGNTNAAFMSVSTSMDTSLFLLPVFTDWDALNHWKTMMLEKDAVTMLMPFEEVEGIMEKGFGGIVVNPFGPQPFYLPKELAHSILQLQEKKDSEESL